MVITSTDVIGLNNFMIITSTDVLPLIDPTVIYKPVLNKYFNFLLTYTLQRKTHLIFVRYK